MTGAERERTPRRGARAADTLTRRGLRPAAALALCGAALLPAHADQTTATPWFGLADLRQPGAARVYPLDGRPGSTPARLRFLPLAPPAEARIACCLQPARARAAADDIAPVVERLGGGDERPLPARALAKPPRSATAGGPVIALALAGAAPRVEAVSAHRLRLRWSGLPAWRVDHCASSEGLHLRLQPEDGSAPVRAVYLPLGMDVEADCPADLLAVPSGPTK